jgi:signal transduction histidine kinase/CheY-like chemotaxis protein
MKKQLKHRFPDIASRVQAAVLLTSAISLLLYAIVTAVLTLSQLNQLNQKKLTTLASVTAHNLEAPLLFADPRAAADTLTALADETSIVSAELFDGNGKSLARYQRSQYADSAWSSWLPEALNRAQFTQEINLAGNYVGILILRASRDQFWEAALRNLLVCLLLTALALAASWIAARRLRRVISQPIHSLIDATHSIANNKRFSTRVPEAGNNELGQLTRSFNTMISEIETRDQILAHHRDDLEARVAARTAELLASRDAAQQANRFKSRFLANMSHEIRTPLHAILGASTLLQKSLLTPEQRHLGLTLEQSGKTLLHLINDILDLTKIEAGRIELKSEDFCLSPMLENCVRQLAGQAHDKALELQILPAAELPEEFVGDEQRIQQIVLNLLGNAIKFTPSGYVAVRTRAMGTTSGSPVRIRIEVEDTGIGIGDEDINSLFRPFAQGENAAKQTGGTGLGLTISRSLANQLGGHIQLQHRSEHGTICSVELPLKSSGKAPPLAPAGLTGKRVLLLTGRTLLARTLEHLLGQAGVSLYHDVPAAVAQPLDLLLVDVDRDPPEAPHLPKVLQQVPKIALTAWTQITPPGFVAHLASPLSRQEVWQTLATQLGVADGDYSCGCKTPTPGIPQFEGEILLVDDDSSNRDIGCRLLTLMGCRVEVANDGEEALRRALEHDFDLIMMDCKMPVMDGYEAARRLREEEATRDVCRTAIIALTANTYPEDRRRCLNAGMDDFLPKPFNESELAELLEKWLGPPHRHANESAVK